MLAEILGEIDCRDPAGITFLASEDLLVGMIFGMIIYQDHLAFISIPSPEAFHTSICNLAYRFF